MRPAHYSLVRYIGDAARNEPLNVGIVAWTDEGQFDIRVDDGALARVTRENPHLTKDAVLGVRSILREKLEELDASTAAPFLHLIESQRGYPILLSEARMTTISSAQQVEESLGDAVSRLTARLVTPRRRGGGGQQRPVDVLEKAFEPLFKARKVERHHLFEESRSGRIRAVDFYVNGGADVAVDAVNFELKDADDIAFRADAEAFKVVDILGGSPTTKYLVYCKVSADESHVDVNDSVERVLKSAGAEPVLDAVDVVDRVFSLVGQPRPSST